MVCFRSYLHAIFQALACCLLCLSIPSLHAQLASPASTGSLAGTVVDPQGALIPQASITVTRVNGGPITITADELGRYTAPNLKPGLYTIEAQAPGFRPTRKESVAITAGTAQHLNLTLEIEVQQQQVVVSDAEIDPSPDKNGSAIVLKGKDLASLSDDQNELQQQLQAIAGSDPESPPQFYVDGFSGGKLPPKSSIREIRINQNPYSAQYDAIGYGRIEIFTKPGTDKLHGDYWMQGNDSSFNTQNPFVANQPPYYSYQYEGDVNGPINKATSYFLSAYNQNSATDSIINTEILDANFKQVSFKQAIATPNSYLTFSPRVDLQLGKTQTISLRYQLQRTTQTNGGVGQSNLISQAFNSTNVEQVIQFSDTQAYGAKMVNETRFQYIRDRNNQNALTGGPTIAVQGAFTDGGSAAGATHDNQDHYEFQDYLQTTAGKHDLNFGVRFRSVRDSNLSTANFNGQYTFASLDSYQITEQGISAGLTPTQIRANGGGASQYTQTQGKPNIAVTLMDTGVYAEDNWKVNPQVTLSYGLRFETQTDIHDHADFGPRLGASWAIPGGKNKPPKAVLRAGGGFFYERFQSTNVLQARRQNGITESAVVVNNPDFFPTNCVAAPTGCNFASSSTQATTPTIYQINPKLRTPQVFMTGVSVDKPLGKYASVTASYMYSSGKHLLLSRNINAPLPGTYVVGDPNSGTRPLGINENIDEFDSEGDLGRHRFVINGNLHAKHVGLFGAYIYSHVLTNSEGATSFPSNGYDLHQDYGRGINNLHNRLFLGGFVDLPHKISLNPFIIYQSSAPFNITVGQDLNGDTQFNDRPAFATDLTRPSVYKTKYGNFDSLPIPGQTIIPIDYGKGPALFVANLRLMKHFSFGPVVPDENPPADAAVPAKDTKTDTKTPSKTDAKPDAKPASKTPAKPVKKEVERRYELGLGAGADNIFNHVNLAVPGGVLGSPLFGKSTATASLFGNASANRTVQLEMFFRF